MRCTINTTREQLELSHISCIIAEPDLVDACIKRRQEEGLGLKVKSAAPVYSYSYARV